MYTDKETNDEWIMAVIEYEPVLCGVVRDRRKRSEVQQSGG